MELKPQNGRHAVLRFLHHLVEKEELSQKVSDRVSSVLKVTLDAALARLAQHARPGSLVYIISDFRGLNDAVDTGIAKLSQHCEVVLIFIYDPLEISLPAKGRFRFTDSDREVIIDTYDQQRLLSYQQHFQQRQQHLETLAKKRGLTLIQCSTSDEPVQCLR